MKRFKWFVLACGLMASAQDCLAANTAEWCEQAWREVSSKTTDPESPELLNDWQQYEDRCVGTVVYEARLSIANSLRGDTGGARNILKSVDTTKSPYGYLVEFAIVYADMVDAMKRQATEEDVRRLAAGYKDVVSKAPSFLEGYALLGGMETLLDKHMEAIESLEKAKSSPMRMWGVNRNLTISYTAVGRYADALHAADAAIAENRALTSDPYFVLALARSNAETGDLDHAELALRVIASKVPAVRETKEFADTVHLVLAKKERAKAN